MRTRREIRRDIRRMERVVKAASVADDGPDFVHKRRLLERLREELAALDAPPRPALPPAGTGEFTMRRARPVNDTDADRWRRVVAMRHGVAGAGRNIYAPEADATRAAKVRNGQEHVTGLIRRSAMRAGGLPSRFR